MSTFGTPNQERYASNLIERSSQIGSLEELARQALGDGVEFEGDRLKPLTSKQASEAITWLEDLLQIKRSPKTKSPQDTDSTPVTTVGRILTARHIRRIAKHEESLPEDADEDARWVLIQLQRLEAIEFLVSGAQTDQPLGVNGSERIKTELLIKYFGSYEVAAEAFGVSLGTIKSWGLYIPPQQEFRAEVVTNGYVRATRKPVTG